MRLDLENLPSDIGLLHSLVCDMAVVVETRDDEIERLQRIIKQLQRARFGRRSERLDSDQLAFGLEDLGADIARAETGLPPLAPGKEQKPGSASDDRPSLPDHLPREDVKLDIGAGACPCCGGAIHKIGETVSEMLDYVPARLRVLRIRRPKYGCRACGTIHQAPAPERPIAQGGAVHAGYLSIFNILPYRSGQPSGALL